MQATSSIFVAGGATLAGVALIQRLRQAGFRNLVGTPPDEPDLCDQGAVEAFFSWQPPEYVFFAAGKSGGIQLNQTQPAGLALDNLLAVSHVLSQAHRHGCKKLLYLASSCCYPKQAEQPLRVESLMTGLLEPISAAYATAKLAGIQLCQAYRRQFGANFICVIPGDLFGPHDTFDRAEAHVLPALMAKLHEAKRLNVPSVTLWGTGAPKRQFLYAPDLADTCIFLMRNHDGAEPINVGGGIELPIRELATTIAEMIDYRGELRFDGTNSDGSPRKALDSSPLHALGWNTHTNFRSALLETYQWFLRNVASEEPRRVCEAV